MLKRKLIIVAIVAAALPTLASAQSPSNTIGTVINPDDSGYHTAIYDNPYQANAGAARASSSAMLPVAVNPDDSGYHSVVTENPYKGKAAEFRASSSAKLGVVFNSEDSGYLGPVN